jgi:hypothetical protein
MAQVRRPAGITALSGFFAFGTLMSGLTVVLLLFPGGMLEPVWRLNPRAREGFTGMGSWAVLLMIVVSGACATASVGLWRCTRWGLWVALMILAVNLIGDATNAIVAHDGRALIGLPIGGL